MIKLFSSSTHAVIKTELPGSAVPGLVKFTGNSLRWPESVIITGVGVSQMENVQFVQSLSDYVYVYAFGSRVGSIRVQGMVLLGKVDGNCKANPNAAMKSFFSFYGDGRASKLGKPLKFQLAGVTVSGYLTGSEINLLNESPGIASFTFTLASTTLAEVGK